MGPLVRFFSIFKGFNAVNVHGHYIKRFADFVITVVYGEESL